MKYKWNQTIKYSNRFYWRNFIVYRWNQTYLLFKYSINLFYLSRIRIRLFYYMVIKFIHEI